MLSFWNYKGGLRSQQAWNEGCWLQATCPTEKEEKFLTDTLEIPHDFLSDIRDKDERARYEYDDGWTLIILRIPYVRNKDKDLYRKQKDTAKEGFAADVAAADMADSTTPPEAMCPESADETPQPQRPAKPHYTKLDLKNDDADLQRPYTTVPLGIIFNKGVFVTVCYYETNMMLDFVQYHTTKRTSGFIDNVDLTFRLFLSSAVWYLKRLKQINTKLEEAKRNLDHTIDNNSLIALSRLQDSLTYFITSIRANESLLSKLKGRLPIDELDADLIEDINVEMSQARETTNIYNNILDSTMETYASIINNNMSGVMKQMTSVSIILMFPTLIASIYGMNLINGMEEWPWGFPLVIGTSVIVTGLFWWLFRKKTWI